MISMNEFSLWTVRATGSQKQNNQKVLSTLRDDLFPSTQNGSLQQPVTPVPGDPVDTCICVDL